MKMSRIAAGLLFSFAAAGAQAALLSSLLNGGSIVAGDKLFDSWQLVSYTSSDAARSFNAGNIDVQALSDGGDKPGPGLRFTASSNELTVTGDGIYAFVDLMFGFRVSVLDPSRRITDNSLTMTNASLTLNPQNGYDLGAYIREVIGTGAGLDNLGAKNVEFSLLGDPGSTPNPTSKLNDSAVFGGQDQVWVTKNILVWATDTSNTANLTQFEQRFSQTKIPEPSSFALFGLGLFGLGWMRGRIGRNSLARIE